MKQLIHAGQRQRAAAPPAPPIGDLRRRTERRATRQARSAVAALVLVVGAAGAGFAVTGTTRAHRAAEPGAWSEAPTTWASGSYRSLRASVVGSSGSGELGFSIIDGQVARSRSARDELPIVLRVENASVEAVTTTPWVADHEGVGVASGCGDDGDPCGSLAGRSSVIDGGVVLTVWIDNGTVPFGTTIIGTAYRATLRDGTVVAGTLRLSLRSAPDQAPPSGPVETVPR